MIDLLRAWHREKPTKRAFELRTNPVSKALEIALRDGDRDRLLTIYEDELLRVPPSQPMPTGDEMRQYILRRIEETIEKLRQDVSGLVQVKVC